MKDTLKGKKTYLSLIVTAAAVLLGINQIERVEVIPLPELPITEEVLGDGAGDLVVAEAAEDAVGTEIVIAPEGTRKRSLLYSLAALAGIALAAYSRSLAQPK
jgi:hypothetical protein